MIQRFNRISLWWGIPGCSIQIVGAMLHISQDAWLPPNAFLTIGIHLMWIGTLTLLVGAANYAKAKGRSPAWCLFGLLGFPGVIVMVIVLASLQDLSSDGRAVTG